MSKIAELQQNYQDISTKYDELYGDMDYQELPEEGCNLLIEKLEANLKLKEATYDIRTFNRYYKPVLLQKISVIRGRLQSQKFLQGKVKA